MKLILALGNPGRKYRDTRHNVGWWLADRLRSAWSLPGWRESGAAEWTSGTRGGTSLCIARPLTYVNRSGRVLDELRREERLEVEEDLLVVVDDVDLPPGTFRLRARGSSGGHRGLGSIERSLDTRAYPRLRIGVGRPDDERIDLADWVLAPVPGPEEEAIVGSFDRQTLAVECWMEEGIEEAMNRFNASS